MRLLQCCFWKKGMHYTPYYVGLAPLQCVWMHRLLYTQYVRMPLSVCLTVYNVTTPSAAACHKDSNIGKS